MDIKSIAIGTFLEPDLVEGIMRTFPDLNVVYEPDILPAPRYKCDHSAPARELSNAQLKKWIELTSGVDAYFDFNWYQPEKMVDRNPSLRWIQATSAGIGSFMKRSGLDKTPVIVTTAGGIHAVPLSEFALMGALYFTKSIPLLEKWKGQAHWERYTTSQLAGKKVLIIGLGGIGMKTAETFHKLGLQVIGLSRKPSTGRGSVFEKIISKSDLKAELSRIDIIVICCPLTSETQGMLGIEEFAAMKPETILVNISRGQVVDQDSMIAALGSGTLLGACLDVFNEEPLPSDNILWRMPNVIISPHSASTVASENASLVELFCQNLPLIERGSRPKNLYEAARGY